MNSPAAPSSAVASASRLALAVLLVAVGCTGVAGCGDKGEKNPIAKIEGLRDALEKDDAAAIKTQLEGKPPCPEAEPVALGPGQASPRDTGCLAQIATALGSKKGFSPSPPDQAAAATAAVVLMREGRGDYVAHLENWLGSLKGGKGPGPDALRLAVASRMAAAAPQVGRKIEEDPEAIAAMKAVAGAIPGACPTYALLGAGRDATKLPAELSADHATCVHRDLGRREGPGSGYGAGVFRGLEGALAAWRETERALRMGLANATPGVKAKVEAKLAIIEPATQAIATKKLASTTTAAVAAVLGDVHADAGYLIWDAGADGGREGGAPGGSAAPRGSSATPLGPAAPKR